MIWLRLQTYLVTSINNSTLTDKERVMKESELKEMVDGLMELLTDCHAPAADTRDWVLIDRINDTWTMLEGISNSIK